MGYCRTISTLTDKLVPYFGERACSWYINSASVAFARRAIEDADQATQIVLPFARNLAKQIGLKPTAAVKEGPNKRLLRIFEKAIGKYDGQVREVPDIARMRILFEKPEDIENLRTLILGGNPRYYAEKQGGSARLGFIQQEWRHPCNNIELTEFEDFCHIPSSTGRVGVHMQLKVRIPGKRERLYEIQCLHKDMQTTEDLTHNNYMNAHKIRRTAMSEGRDLTPEEERAIEAYDNSSKERYLADSLRLDLFPLRRPDLRFEEQAIAWPKLAVNNAA